MEKKNNIVVMAFDATRELKENELQLAIENVNLTGGILGKGDTLVVLGVLHSLQHPMGYQAKPYTDYAFGTNDRALEVEAKKKLHMFVSLLRQCAGQLSEDQLVGIKVKITAGSPMRKVVVQEAILCKATWAVIDRHLRKDLKFFVRNIPCKVAVVQDGFSVDVKRHDFISTNESEFLDQKFYTLSKSIESTTTKVEDDPVLEKEQHSVTTCSSYPMSSISQDHCSGEMSSTSHTTAESWDQVVCSEIAHSHKRERTGKQILCAGCGLRTFPYIRDSIRFKLSEIQMATSDFSKENLLGEGGFGYVYKGKLKDGRMIAAKLHKEASSQGYSEFQSEVCVLNYARHKNIVMLLGICSKERNNILVYEYICNGSLEWHLFSQSAPELEWHKRYAIAIGVAKGLRFLHEECRGGPIIHRDLRPSNILITHDFVPMIGDFGLAKWKTGDQDTIQTRVLGTFGYLAPEYVEYGTVSVRVDVYAFGVVLLQLISGRKAVTAFSDGRSQPLIHWAEPIIQRLALHELIDPRIGEAYDTYEVYHMAKAAYLCVQRKPEMRPSMSQVLQLLEGNDDHVHQLTEQFMMQNTN